MLAEVTHQIKEMIGADRPPIKLIFYKTVIDGSHHLKVEIWPAFEGKFFEAQKYGLYFLHRLAEKFGKGIRDHLHVTIHADPIEMDLDEYMAKLPEKEYLSTEAREAVLRYVTDHHDLSPLENIHQKTVLIPTEVWQRARTSKMFSSIIADIVAMSLACFGSYLIIEGWQDLSIRFIGMFICFTGLWRLFND